MLFDIDLFLPTAEGQCDAGLLNLEDALLVLQLEGELLDDRLPEELLMLQLGAEELPLCQGGVIDLGDLILLKLEAKRLGLDEFPLEAEFLRADCLALLEDVLVRPAFCLDAALPQLREVVFVGDPLVCGRLGMRPLDRLGVQAKALEKLSPLRALPFLRRTC